MLAVSLTPHARCMRGYWHCMHSAFGVMYRKIFKLLRKGIIIGETALLCGVNETACTIGKRFVRPWQPLKGISIKNVYVRELSYPTLTPHARYLRPEIRHVSENSQQNSERLKPVNKGPRGYCLMKRNRKSKISWHCPFEVGGKKNSCEKLLQNAGPSKNRLDPQQCCQLLCPFCVLCTIFWPFGNTGQGTTIQHIFFLSIFRWWEPLCWRWVSGWLPIRTPSYRSPSSAHCRLVIVSFLLHIWTY
jgi:hypothetical protein